MFVCEPDSFLAWNSERHEQFYIDSGTPAKFYQEYMNQAKSPEDQIFSEEDISDGIYQGNARFDEEADSWYIQFANGDKEYINIYIGVDPASTRTRASPEVHLLASTTIKIRSTSLRLERAVRFKILLIATPVDS